MCWRGQAVAGVQGFLPRFIILTPHRAHLRVQTPKYQFKTTGCFKIPDFSVNENANANPYQFQSLQTRFHGLRPKFPPILERPPACPYPPGPAGGALIPTPFLGSKEHKSCEPRACKTDTAEEPPRTHSSYWVPAPPTWGCLPESWVRGRIWRLLPGVQGASRRTGLDLGGWKVLGNEADEGQGLLT